MTVEIKKIFESETPTQLGIKYVTYDEGNKAKSKKVIPLKEFFKKKGAIIAFKNE